MSTSKIPAPPQVSPYLFPGLLAVLGLWCFYDGWFSTDPKMLEHQTFNQIASVVLLLWSVADVLRTRRLTRRLAARPASPEDQQS